MDHDPLYIELGMGTPSFGHWCDRCQLPSVVKAPMNILDENGVSQVGEVVFCTDHS